MATGAYKAVASARGFGDLDVPKSILCDAILFATKQSAAAHPAGVNASRSLPDTAIKPTFVLFAKLSKARLTKYPLQELLY